VQNCTLLFSWKGTSQDLSSSCSSAYPFFLSRAKVRHLGDPKLLYQSR
jgi:hypothetical protein